MQSYFRSPWDPRHQTDSSVPMTVSTFPIQRLPDEILSRVIDVGSWADHEFDLSSWPPYHEWAFRYRRWTSDTKPRQKDLVKKTSQVCSRWREIAQWQGHPHRWHMCLMFNCGMTPGSPSRELSSFRRGLRASDGCDLLVKLASWKTRDLNSDFEVDDTAVVDMQLFMHGIKMLLPYLSQILRLEVESFQSDPLHLVFGILQRWTTRSRLTSLRIRYMGGGRMRELPSSLLDFRHLGLSGSKSEDDMPWHPLPPTLADVCLSSVRAPKTFALPYGLTRLSYTGQYDNIRDKIDFRSLIPHPSQLTYLDLDLRNTVAPSTEFRLDGVSTFWLQIDLMSLLTWSQVLHAKSLQHLDLTVTHADSDESHSMADFSLPSDDDKWLPLLGPVHLSLTCSAIALRGILSLLTNNGLVIMTLEFRHRGPISGRMSEYLESRSMEYDKLIFPLLQTLSIVTSGESWSRSLRDASFPALESLSCTRPSPKPLLTDNPRVSLNLTEWVSFSSNHERNSFMNLVKLQLWLPAFKAGQVHPFEYTPNVVELQVDLRLYWPKDRDKWMIYPGTCPSPHSPPLTRLRILAAIVGINRHYSPKDNLAFNPEDDLVTQIHGIHASRVQHGVGLERARIQWVDKTTEFRQNVTTGFLERVI